MGPVGNDNERGEYLTQSFTVEWRSEKRWCFLFLQSVAPERAV